MRASLPFFKMHGLGNDFVVVEATAFRRRALSARELCDRHFGVGADQLLILRQTAGAFSDFEMKIQNQDGSPASMCGNGIRAAALYARTQGWKCKKPHEWLVLTDSGILTVRESGKTQFDVEMGIPHFMGHATVQGTNWVKVDVGNPHAVTFVQGVDEIDIQSEGRRLEFHPRTGGKQGTNVEWVEIKGPRHIRVGVWERGAGATLACGTGACAAAAAAIRCEKVKPGAVRVDLPGGSLTITWAGPGKMLKMRGPAQVAYQGEI